MGRGFIADEGLMDLDDHRGRGGGIAGRCDGRTRQEVTPKFEMKTTGRHKSFGYKRFGKI